MIESAHQVILSWSFESFKRNFFLQNPQRDFIEVHKRLIINLIQAMFEAGSFYLRFIWNGYLMKKEKELDTWTQREEKLLIQR